jgi:uncharacterized membrane protein YcaP (DUF421 family)
METLIELFGTGKDLTAVQMSCRGIVIFILTLILLRISGRRSFGLHTPLDNIIVILLGALMSRAIVGVSPFWPIVAVSLVIVLMHRIIGWITIHSTGFRKLTQGSKIAVYTNGKWQEDNMNKALIGKDDVLRGVRKSALTEDLNKIDTVYMERNGEISVIKKTE